MELDEWLSLMGEVVPLGELRSPEAGLLAFFLERYASDFATVVESRCGEGREFVIIDIETGRPQKSVYPIKRTERIGIGFAKGDVMPWVYMLRADFPDTPHQQLVLEGSPKAICIDDRPWSEAQLTWTPGELIHRILSWFSRAGRGELHDARQPLDPQMIGSPLSFIISRDLLRRAAELDLIAVHAPEHKQTLRVCSVKDVRDSLENLERICLTAYSVPPENMTRMKFAPNNLGSLVDMLEERGIDVVADLTEKFSDWLRDGESSMWRINSRFCAIVEMPIIAPDGSEQGGVDLRAFLSDQTVGKISVALGLAMEAGAQEGSKIGYVPQVMGQIDDAAVRNIPVLSAEVHYEFDRRLASDLAGRSQEDTRQAVIVGAGAIGSHVADCLMREGRFTWTVIDDDLLLPHNIGKHIGRRGDVTKGKAALLANWLSETIDSSTPAAKHIAANVMCNGDNRAQIDEVLGNADLIIDATASIVAERYIADHQAAARRASIFFNPAGNSGVILAEPADRGLTLRDLEAQYLGLITCDQRLEGHLNKPDGTFAYTGACRAITNMIPESCVMALSGLISAGLGKAVDQEEGIIRVWSMSNNGSVDVIETAPAPVQTFRAGDWKITIDQGLIDRIREMRHECLPKETGGVLTGVIDIPAKRIHLVDAGPAPEDSVSSVDGFVRGSAGVQEYLDRIQDQSAGQVRYIGEWHSHPPRTTTLPSPTDLVQLDWLASLFDMDTLPALMLLAGGSDMRLILSSWLPACSA